MVLLGTFPTFFLGEVQFFFSGLEAGPTYRPPVRHSNPDTPLNGMFTNLIPAFIPSSMLRSITILAQSYSVCAISASHSSFVDTSG